MFIAIEADSSKELPDLLLQKMDEKIFFFSLKLFYLYFSFIILFYFN